MNYKRSKIMFALFIVACLLFFTSDFQLIDVQKTAIIVALGVDLTDAEIEVTAQIAIPQAEDTQPSNRDAIISAKGKTLYQAINNIALNTGWYPKLSFCNLVVLGQDLIKANYMPVVDYMLASYRIHNSTMLACAENTAKEVLSSPSPLDYISSFALEKILFHDAERADSVLETDIRAFCSQSQNLSKCAYLPVIKILKTSDKSKGNEPQSEQNSEQGSIEPQGYKSIIGTLNQKNAAKNKQKTTKTFESKAEDKNSQAVVFDARSALFFSNEKAVFQTTAEQTLCYNLLTQKVQECFLPVSYKKGGSTIDSVIAIVKNKARIKIETSNAVPVLKIDLKLYCKNEETADNLSNDKLTEYSVVCKDALYATESKVKQLIDELLQKSKQTDCDLLRLKERLYRYTPAKYSSLKDTVLSGSQISINVVCENFK